MLLHTAGIIHREVIIIMLTMDAVISALIPRQAKLLGGSKGIYRRVSNIHTIETKEIAHFIRDHELIFITGVAVSKDTPLEELVRTILKKMSQVLWLILDFTSIPFLTLSLRFAIKKKFRFSLCPGTMYSVICKN